ncbi:MAG: hypothetical protein KGI29_08610 [Pseudomonadota bacterium]|nr:hypothetical protein [Pseudomonadota bacterium]MDE3037815.1 hypothetical protein [Pseudomonadota bacterium]
MKHRFEALPIPRKDPARAPIRYRVYGDATSFKLVEADNAAGALMASGLAKAWRIERYTPTSSAVLDSQIFSEVAATPPAAAATPETAEQKPPETAAPLSSEDVNKLLQESPTPTASA